MMDLDELESAYRQAGVPYCLRCYLPLVTDGGDYACPGGCTPGAIVPDWAPPPGSVVVPDAEARAVAALIAAGEWTRRTIHAAMTALGDGRSGDAAAELLAASMDIGTVLDNPRLRSLAARLAGTEGEGE